MTNAKEKTGLGMFGGHYVPPVWLGGGQCGANRHANYCDPCRSGRFLPEYSPLNHPHRSIAEPC
jgi:hypothetical protein